jgi:hypothetical protein
MPSNNDDRWRRGGLRRLEIINGDGTEAIPSFLHEGAFSSLLWDRGFCILCVVMSLSERAAKAAKIAEEPNLYKVCEGCDSIVTKRVATCPSCHGYRFNEDPSFVVEQAKILGSREQRSVLTEDLL